MAVVLALSKGRASDFHLLCVCRRVAAHVLCLNSTLRVRWVMSELNRADKPSRLHMTQNDYKQEARLSFLKSRKLGRHRQSALSPLPDQ
eukprot:7015958-Karenia_brevis.AAC.1